MPGEAHELATPESPTGLHSTPLYRKLLLSAVLMGSELSMAFEHLYEVPALQILGVPVTYASLTPIISGPSAMVLMHLLGYFSDKGQNHRQRKIAVVVFNSFMILSGIVFLILANCLVMSKSTDTTVQKNDTVTCEAHSDENSQVANMTNLNSTAVSSLRSWNSSSAVTEPEEEVDLLSLPLPGVLGLLGFLAMDIGYDLNIAASRSCILACSSPQEHWSLLVVALVMAGVGGCITSLLGTLDLSAVFHTSGDRLLTQTTVQLIVCFPVIIACLICTIVTALINIKQMDRSHIYTSFEEDQTAEEENTQYGTFHHDEVPLHHEHNRVGETSKLSIQETSLSENWSDSVQISARANSAETENHRDQETVMGENSSSSFSHDVQSKLNNASLEHVKKQKSSDLKRDQRGRPSRQKSQCVIACITCFFGSSVLYSYNLFVAHFLGTEVMGGDSSAPPGSEKLHAYEDAMRAAASGLLLFFGCYLGVGLVHNKLLAFWGLRVDFSLSHVLMSAAILSLTLSKQVALYYVCCVVYGFQRSALYSVPFIIADNYVHEQTAQGQVHGSAVGKAMAVVTSMIPLNYCTLYLVSGPLITLTHYDGAPLILASVSAFLAAVIFLLYKP